MNHQTDHAADRFAALRRHIDAAAGEGRGQTEAQSIADALAGSTAQERQQKREQFNQKADALEARIRAAIAARQQRLL